MSGRTNMWPPCARTSSVGDVKVLHHLQQVFHRRWMGSTQRLIRCHPISGLPLVLEKRQAATTSCSGLVIEFDLDAVRCEDSVMRIRSDVCSSSQCLAVYQPQGSPERTVLDVGVVDAIGPRSIRPELMCD